MAAPSRAFVAKSIVVGLQEDESGPATCADSHREPSPAGAVLPAAKQATERWSQRMAYRDTETVIVDRGASPVGIIAGIAVVVLIVLGFFLFFNGNNGGGGTIDVDVPAVTVDVQPDGQ
jgi:hypothetical protein